MSPARNPRDNIASSLSLTSFPSLSQVAAGPGQQRLPAGVHEVSKPVLFISLSDFSEGFEVMIWEKK